ncbi:MAG: molybdopterin dinucleotide binding domain-containing protein, partial [Desulfotomaculales bacterium]
IETKNGQIRLRVRTTADLAPGVVSVPHGWAHANVNLLVDMDEMDPITAYPDFKAVLCRIAPAG